MQGGGGSSLVSCGAAKFLQRVCHPQRAQRGIPTPVAALRALWVPLLYQMPRLPALSLPLSASFRSQQTPSA